MIYRFQKKIEIKNEKKYNYYKMKNNFCIFSSFICTKGMRINKIIDFFVFFLIKQKWTIN